MTSSDAFATRAIHVGQEPDAKTGAMAVPIYQTSTFAMDEPGVLRAGYDYSRSGNPTRSALQQVVASLEGGTHGQAFASGMAAIDCLLRSVLRTGDHLIMPADGYGGTFRMLDQLLVPWGVSYSSAPLEDLDAVRAALRPATRLIWCETPTNPLLGIADIAALATIAHQAGALFAVDNTFASPYLQTPLALGADVVMHSTTKYIGGHSDVIGGALVTNDDELGEKFSEFNTTVGSMAAPFDSWLALRGAKTLAVRMERHCDNAERIAEMLCGLKKVGRVFYPGLPNDPGHEVAVRQMRRFGGMVSFTVVGGLEEAIKVCSRTRLFTLAESLGGVESLIDHPATMTHASVVGTDQAVAGEVIRLSVGLEDADDLVADLADALA
ncbi:MAG: cystathionine gamma-synthase [Nakamurella sp.]